MTFYLHDALKKYFNPDKSLFDQLMAMQGEPFRTQKGRVTQRIVLGNKSYFVKQHTGVGWREICKNLLQGRMPVLSAKNEWCAIEKLHALGQNVPRLVAYGERGSNPARLQSFVLMEELTHTISLEDYCKVWPYKPPSFIQKQRLLAKVARMTRCLHENGINHRDLYICHFLLTNNTDSKQGPRLFLIDWHRAQMRSLTPKRWIIKDLAGLYFSSKDIGLTQRDLYRFMRIYRHKPLRDMLTLEKTFWQKVIKRGEALYRDHSVD